jgi:RNA polymerase-binding transcription factor DksA
MAVQTAIDARKAMLLERLDRLDRRLHEIEHELEGHTERDWSELAQSREGDEVLERQGTSGQLEIAAIRAALGRIEAGTYGVCAKCGDDIEAERLDLLPHTPLCAACAGARRG